MDRYSKILVALTAVTIVLTVLADAAYAKYRASGNRYPSTVVAMDRAS